MKSVGCRGTGLMAIFTALVLLVACGRATDQEIDQALGIEPTATIDPTVSAGQTATAAFDESQAGSPGADGRAVPVAVAGNPLLGRSRFNFVCAICHTVGGGGSAPDLLAAGGAGAGITLEELQLIVREGQNHPPGPYQAFQVTDDDIANIAALILEQAGP